MARRNQSTLEDMVELTSKLPWWAGGYNTKMES